MKKDRLQKSLEIFGLQAVMDAVHEGKEFDKIFMEKGLNTGLAMELRALLKEHNIMFKAVPVEKLNRLTQKSTKVFLLLYRQLTFINWVMY